MVYNENAAYNSGGEDLRECEAMRKIFVGGLNRNSKDEDFSEVFAQFGTILDSVIIKDPHTKGSRGFGFVTYDTSEAVEKCFQGRPHMLDGKALDTKRAIPREYNTSSAHARTKKLFIGGISYEMSPDDIQQYIESRHPRDYGFIEKVDILKDRETGKNKTFGFLYCSTEDFADRLIISEPQFQLNGRNMSIKKAEPKNEGGAGPNRGGRGGSGGGMRGGRGGGRGGSYGGNQGGDQQQGYGGYGGGQGSYGGGNTQSYGNQGGYGGQAEGYGNQGGYGQQGNQGGYSQGNQGGYNQGNQGGGYNQGGYGAGGYGQQQQPQQQQYSTSYPTQQQSYGGGYNNYNSGGDTNSYGSGRGGSRGGGAGGGNRYAPY